MNGTRAFRAFKESGVKENILNYPFSKARFGNMVLRRDRPAAIKPMSRLETVVVASDLLS